MYELYDNTTLMFFYRYVLRIPFHVDRRAEEQ
jgi:hypothetical protein